MMAVTSHDVARLAGVSQATVSRALRDDPRVSAETRDAVAGAARALGYVRSEIGRSLSTRSTHQIAMVADLDNALYPRLVAPLHDALMDRGYRMVVLAERGDEMAAYSRLLDGSVDGAVLTTSQLRSSLPFMLRSRQFPFVQMNRISDLADADSVTADNRAGAAAVAALLAQSGHTRIALVAGPDTTSSSRDREAGFRGALEEHGIDLPPRRVARGEFTYDDGSRALRELMSLEDRPTAVFCVTDLLAVGAIHEAHVMGLGVPEDVSIVGFDDLELAAWPGISLTTVSIDFPQMAELAADLILARLTVDKTAPTKHHVLSTELILRGTHQAPTSR